MILRVLIFGLACFAANIAAATPPNEILSAKFIEPTRRYDHGILGDAVEWGAMRVRFDTCFGCEASVIFTRIIRLPENRVFEDIAPRIIRDEFGLTSIMVVETDIDLGARLSIYSADRLDFATPFIGRTHRWLAPIGAGDLDGDGVPEIAYVEKPHLSKELKIWRYTEEGLTFLTSKEGLTNHRIGEDFITGGIRDCGQGPEIITADGNWSRIMTTVFEGGKLKSRSLGPFAGKASVKAAMACKF